MSLEEFEKNFSSKIEEKKEDSEREQISKVLKKNFNVGFKLLYGDIYIFTDGQVGIGYKNGKIQSIQKINWNFESTYFSININKIIVDAELIIDGEVQSVKFQYVMPKSEPDEEEQLFDDEELKEISYNDGQGSRDRQASLVIFSKNRAYAFDGKHIPGVCTITNELYTKNGKWSNTTYTILINKGYKISRLRESWGLGYFISDEYEHSEPDFKSLATFKESLGMSELSDEAFCFLVKHTFKKEYIKYCLVQENLETF